MHRVLERQLKRYVNSAAVEELPPEWQALLNSISDTYTHADNDRALLERSLELSSREFGELNKKLRSEKEVIEQAVAERTQELRNEQKKLDEIAQNMDTGAILLDAQGALSFVNAAALKLLGLEKSDGALDVFKHHFPDVPTLEYMAKGLKGEASKVAEAQSGENIFSISFVPLKTETGIFGVLIWLSDITAQKVLERAKDQFIAIASHEMRTPLAIIRGNAELLMAEQQISADRELRTETESILRSAVRLLGIVNDFLDVQHLESSRLTLKIEPVDLSALIRETVGDMLHMAQEKNIALTFNPPPAELPPLKLDRARVQQIFVNIIGNAIHYTDAGGITIALDVKPESVRVVIDDTGRGMDSDDQRRLFGKFQTGKAFLRSQEFGSGLGLYISNLLARLMGGEVKLERSELGKGSTFSVTLPR